MRALFLTGCLIVTGLAWAGAPAPGPDIRAFDVAAGPAEFTLKAFSSQSGVDVVFESRTVSGVQTRPIKGRYRPMTAVGLMLTGTALGATQSQPGSAIVIAPAADTHGAPAPR